MRLLLIEDDKSLGSLCGRGCARRVTRSTGRPTAGTAFAQALADRHDLFILDVMLPGMDGLEVLAELRRNEVRTPVLLLTALDGVDDRVRGLDQGS